MALSITSLFGISACSLNMQATEDQANQNIKVTNDLVGKATASPNDSLIQFDNSIFVSDKAFIVEKPKEPLPRVFKENFMALLRFLLVWNSVTIRVRMEGVKTKSHGKNGNFHSPFGYRLIRNYLSNH